MTRFHDGWGSGAWVAMAFVMLVFWGIIAVAVVAVVRSGSLHHHRDGQVGNDPERILAERFARGEIDADEYTRRRDLLRSR